ncbi:hypothetical protein PGB90_003471 [Kerria lacca]
MLEFQVIVLAAGKGSRITELTARKPKCLLPIGNQPMVYYPLKIIEKYGFKEVFLVVLETAKSEVEFALEKTDLAINVNVVTIPYDCDWGTADSLRHLASYIISDFIVVSSDLLTTINVKSILNFHRKNESSLTAVYLQPNTDVELNFVTPGTKSKTKIEKDLVGIDPVTKRLVFLASASDYEEVLPIKEKLLRKHGNVRIYTNLLDAHFFVMKKWLIKYLTFDKNLTTVKGELIPYVLKKQMSRDNKLPSLIDISPEISPMNHQNEKKTVDIFLLAKDLDYDILAKTLSSYNDHTGDLNPVYLNDNIKCYSYITKEFGIRTNTLHDFYKANKTVANYWNKIVEQELIKISPESVIESTQFDKETCIVGSMTKIAAKTSIKSTIFGTGCVIEQKTRISDCLIMNNVVVKEGCVISNCIICDDVIIENNCTLTSCLVGSQYTVSSKIDIFLNSVNNFKINFFFYCRFLGSHKNEILAEIESLMEI